MEISAIIIDSESPSISLVSDLLFRFPIKIHTGATTCEADNDFNQEHLLISFLQSLPSEMERQ